MKKAVTHNGSFHADDVFASVVLQKVFKGVKIRRTRDEKEIARADIVFDIGRVYDPATGRFDHHQPDTPKRENGIPYSSFGLVWKEFGEKYCGSKDIADRIDEKLVQEIDADDNGVTLTENVIADVSPMSWDEIITMFEPNLFDETEGVNKQFKEAVAFSDTFLRRMVKKEADEIKKSEYVARMVGESPDKRYVVLEKNAMYERMEADFPKLLYVVYPSDVNDSWSVKAMQDAGRKTRKPFPKQWTGKVNEELVCVTGVEDAVFAHNSPFLVVAGSREGALKLLQKALTS